MKKRSRPAIKRQPATMRSFDYLHPQVTEVGANPHHPVAGLNDLVQEVHVLGRVDDGLFAVGMYCNELNHTAVTST